jgi:hypothetical protein
LGDRIDLLHRAKLIELAAELAHFLDFIVIKTICLVTEVPQFLDLVAHLVLYLLALLNHTPVALPAAWRRQLTSYLFRLWIVIQLRSLHLYLEEVQLLARKVGIVNQGMGGGEASLALCC